VQPVVSQFNEVMDNLYFSDVRFVYLTSEINHYRFKELLAIDPSYPDIATASPDSKAETVVDKIISSISTGKLI
jgi:hypothetical protein